jgi:hypothetical protein
MAEPILTRTTVTTVIAGLSATLIRDGDVQAGAWVNAHSSAIAWVVLVAAPTVAGLLARRHTVSKASLEYEAKHALTTLTGVVVTKSEKS